MPVDTKRQRTRPATNPSTVHRIREALASRIGRHKYDMWFERTTLDVLGNRVRVATDSPFVAKWIDSHFSEALAGVAGDALGEPAQIDVRVAPDLFRDRDEDPFVPATNGNGSSNGHAAPPAAARRRGRNDRGTARRRGHHLRQLDDFVTGDSNRLAHAAAVRLIDEQDSGVSPLFIHGECGLGKTHLLQGICRRYIELTGRADSVRYVTGEQFTNEYIAAVRSNQLDVFRKKIRKLDLLAIDDVHFLSNKVRTQSEFLHTLDEIDLSGSRVVLASDEHPRLIKKFSQALISRFLSGMVVRIDRPDRETRIALVKRLARQRSMHLSDGAIETIASRCVGSIRELEGAVTKLSALHAVHHGAATGGGRSDHGEDIGLVLVEQLFKDHGWSPPVPIRIATVLDVVCERIGTSRTDLMGSSRHRKVVLGRALVAYLARDLTTHSYPEIARELGRSYHSTIHTAEQRLRRQMDEQEVIDLGDASRPLPLRELVDQLRHEVHRRTVRG